MVEVQKNPRLRHDALEGITGLNGLYSYVYCMLVSQALVDMPILGGAMFMCGQVATVYFTSCIGSMRTLLSGKARMWRGIVLTLMLLFNLLVVVLYPITLSNPMVWILFALIFTMTTRDMIGRRVMMLSINRGMEEKRFILVYALNQLVAVLIAACLLLSCLSGSTAWSLLGGYVLCSWLEVYVQLKERADLRELNPAAAVTETARLHEKVVKANAFKVYEMMSGLMIVALQMTLMLMYTYLAITAEQVLIWMVLAAMSTLLGREAVELILRHSERKKQTDPTNLLLIGVFLWLYGLILFGRMIRADAVSMVNVYVCLGLCSAGATVCFTCLGRMERIMEAVTEFTTGKDVMGYRRMRAAAGELAYLVGEMLVLAALTALCFVGGENLPRNLTQIGERFQPLMVVPALLVVLGALVSVLRFPLSARYMEKLNRFLHLKAMGDENPALERQLEKVVIQRHRQPFFINAVKALLRPFFKHTLKGVENIKPDSNNPIVFLCNHGEFYGPVVTNLYIPVPIRPWTISEITVDKNEVAAYVYKYTIKRQKWLPEFLKWPIARLIGPVSVWAMNQLESIPVYRNKPRELMTTFRLTVEAMQAGDNLLIFPENPNAEYQGHGYERNGVGELFSGFVMLAPVYYNKTGKCCRFLPMYAHKDNRSLTFGEEIVYDPDNASIDERDRIVKTVSDWMINTAAHEEAEYRAQLAAHERAMKHAPRKDVKKKKQQ